MANEYCCIIEREPSTAALRLSMALVFCCAFSASAVTVEVADGESRAVERAASDLRADLDRACPGHAKDSRRIVVRTVADSGGWESSVRTYSNGVWCVTGADRRGTVFGVYEISRELGVSPFHWMDDIPVEPHEFALAEKTVTIKPPAVKYRGIFINDEDWCLRPWAENTFHKDPSQHIGAGVYEKIFEMMLRARLNTIWPAMHEGGYEFVAREENMALAEEMGIVVGTSHCEPMLRNNVYWDKSSQGQWNYATNKAKIDEYWQWAADRYAKNEVLWTIGIRGTHDSPMSGGGGMADKIALMGEVFKSQTNMLAKAAPQADGGSRAMTFIPYKEVLPIYDAGLPVPAAASIMWVDDNYGYIRRLGGPGTEGHAGGMYWHVSYYGSPHSYTHLCTTAPGFMWYELGAKCIDMGMSEVWILNVGDVKPADVLIHAYARYAWEPAAYAVDGQTKVLREWAEFFGGDTDRIVRHMNDYYALGTLRKPELMSKLWRNGISEGERASLRSRYESLDREEDEIENMLGAKADAWFGAFGFQARFLASAGRYFTSDDWLENSGRERVVREMNALRERSGSIFGGKWKDFWFDTFATKPYNQPWDNTHNSWSSQMQWPWRGGWTNYRAINPPAGNWKDAAQYASLGDAKGGGWRCVEGLGLSSRAMSLLPVRPNVGKGAWMEYEIEGTGNGGQGTGNRKLALQFLPDYRLYPGMKLRVAVSVNGSSPKIAEVPFSDGSCDEMTPGRSDCVQANFVTLEIPFAEIRQGANRIRVEAVDAGVTLDRIGIVL